MNILLKVMSAATISAFATASYSQTLCVFDPIGTQGDAYFFMKDYAVAAKQWGADLTLKAYTDDQKANDDFKNGKCDALSTIGTRARQFNSFTGTLDSIGGLPDDAVAKTAITLIANPKIASDMISGDTEVAGVSVVGPVYPMSNDKNINSMAKMAGKTFGALAFDKPQVLISNKLGCETVPVSISTVGNKFNSGQVQLVALPAYAFKALDLAKGMGTKGAIARYPVAYITTQIVIYPNKFPSGYGQQSRTWIADQLGKQFKATKKIEGAIDARYWAELPTADKAGYNRLFRQVRIDMVKEGLYNKRMAGILKKVRCKQDPSSYECPLQDE